MPSRIINLSIALALTVLAGCSSVPVSRSEPVAAESRSTLTTDNFAAKAVSKQDDAGSASVKTTVEDKESFEPPKPEIQLGTGKFINEEAARRQPPVPGGEGQVDFNFENNPIQAVVKAILGDLLQKNYTIAPNVGGNVSFSTAKPIRADQAMSVLEMLLSWTGNTVIYKDGRYTVLQIKDALPGNLTPRINSPKLAVGYEVRVFPLRYVSPSEMFKLLKPYAKPDAFINIDTARSMLVLAGTASELSNYAQTIEIFDVDWLKGMSVGVFNLQRVEVGTLMPELEKVFGVSGESPLAGMFRFIPIERSNSIIAITAQPEYLHQAEEWLHRLDRAGDESATQLFVYDVKNIKSIDLSDYLSQIFLGGSSGGSSRRTDTSGSVAPGLASATIGAAGAGATTAGSTTGGTSRRSSRFGSARSGAGGSKSGSAATGSVGSGGDTDIRITAVEESNQLLVMATPAEWDAMQGAIRRLDIAPLQVHIETKILEVTLSGDLQYGVKWWFAGLTGEGYDSQYVNPQGVPYPNTSDRQRSLLGAAAPPVAAGSNFFASYLNSKFQVALNALQSSGQAKVLSAPSLMVMNNQEAQINVGTRIPVQTTSLVGLGAVTNTGTGSTGTTTQTGIGSTSYLDTGVILQVKPRVNPGGLVYLEVSQEVSKPGAGAAANGNPPINTRTLDTSIAVQSGDTILLGGLISEDDQTSGDGVPGLSRIPVLGKLFSSTTKRNQRTELIVLITPQVVSNSDEAREVTDEYKRQFQSLAPLRKAVESRSPASDKP
ncbi:type II secretion system secretin GspD [Dokdonella sp.]|mgnify:CR=1 FL=1|uniref:type II secretion system secretin GspD n=2 Tax=Dokdonella sp. TaxID=2291710 RepID=UPI002BC25E97|nr:type II secretion system secretin GspD [Dokdonella sp.]HPN80241.1 type II secretion system secretin GspD [Dokdonella sp.]